MALIDCSECQAEISDQAQACPKCGHPLTEAYLEKARAEHLEQERRQAEQAAAQQRAAQNQKEMAREQEELRNKRAAQRMEESRWYWNVRCHDCGQGALSFKRNCDSCGDGPVKKNSRKTLMVMLLVVGILGALVAWEYRNGVLVLDHVMCGFSEKCDKHGRCNWRNGDCWVDDDGCQDTTACFYEGLCAPATSGNRCGPSKVGCEKSDACTETGLCGYSAGNNTCLVTHAGCKASKGCRKNGACSTGKKASPELTKAGDGSSMGKAKTEQKLACVALSNKDCADSRVCKKDGRCTMYANECHVSVAQGKLDIEERRKEEIESAVQRAEMHKRIETRKRRNEARAARKAEEAKRAAAEAKQLKEKQVFALKVSEAVNVRLQKTCKKLNSSKEPCNCACCALLDGTKKKFCIKYCGTSKQADRVSCY